MGSAELTSIVNRNNLDRLKSHLATHLPQIFSNLYNHNQVGIMVLITEKTAMQEIRRLAQGYTVGVMGTRAGS